MEQLFFCRQCWYLNPVIWRDTGEILWFSQDKDGTQLYKGGKPLGAKCGGNTFHVGDKVFQGIPVQCSRGHVNWIEDTPEQIAEQERLKFNFGKPCQYHDVLGAKCTVRLPCETCIVFENYAKVRV